MSPTPLEEGAPLHRRDPLDVRFIGGFWAIDVTANLFRCLGIFLQRRLDSNWALAMCVSDELGSFFGMSK